MALWSGIGVAVLISMRLTGREQWLLKAGEIAPEAVKASAPAAQYPGQSRDR